MQANQLPASYDIANQIHSLTYKSENHLSTQANNEVQGHQIFVTERFFYVWHCYCISILPLSEAAPVVK